MGLTDSCFGNLRAESPNSLCMEAASSWPKVSPEFWFSARGGNGKGLVRA